MRVIFRTVAVWLLLVAVAIGQEIPWHTVCHIEGGAGIQGPGPINHGSGVLLKVNQQKRGLIVTNKHVVREVLGGPFRVTFGDGQQHRAILVATSRDFDLAALEIAEVERTAAQWTDKIGGEKFYSGGFGDLKKITYKTGNYTGHDRSGRQVNINFTMPIVGGDSGGPVFNEKGEVCGICWGGEEGYDRRYNVQRDGGNIEYYYDDTSAVSGACLAEFLGKVAAKTQPTPQQFCEGCYGNCPPPRYIQPYQPQPEGDGGNIFIPEPPGSRPAPVPAPQSPPPPEAQEDDCRDLISKLEERIVALEARKPEKGEKGDPGEPGPAGPAGPQGIAGKDGKDAQFDVEAVTNALAAALPPIHVEQQDYNTGEVLDTGQVKLGGTLVLRYGVKQGESKDARPQ